jgi:hypothetical protein
MDKELGRTVYNALKSHYPGLTSEFGMDPVTLFTSLGVSSAIAFFQPILIDLAADVAKDGAKNYVTQAFVNVFSGIHKDALTRATGQALKELLELIENELLGAGLEEPEIHTLMPAVKRFIHHDAVRSSLEPLFLDPDYKLDPKLFASAWQQPDMPSLPTDFSWGKVSRLFSRKVRDIRNASGEIKQTFDALQDAGNATALKEIAGLPPDFDLDAYSSALIMHYGKINFDNIDTSGASYNAVRLWNIFVPQSVRECRLYRPQLLEIPKEHQRRLTERGELDSLELAELEKMQESMRHTYFDQPARPVLDVCADTTLPRLVILGDPGSGKSSLLRYLALSWARTDSLRDTEPLPLLIELRAYNHWECLNGKSFPAYLHYASTWHRFNQHTLDFLLKQPERVLLLLDGLDEIFDPIEREQVLNDIQRFCIEYPHTRIILTSRVVGYQAQRLRDADFSDFMLQDLDAAQIEDFLNRWHIDTFGDQGEAKRKQARLSNAIRDSKPIAQLAGNPLLLTLMAIINRNQELPRNRAMLYEKAAEVLLQQWDTERALQAFPGMSDEIDLRAKTAILHRVAMLMQQGGTDGKAANFITGDALLKLIETYLRYELFFPQSHAAAVVLVKQLRERNFILCFLGADSYAFVHRTFMEYFCAADFVQRYHKERTLTDEQLLEVFDQYCRVDDWREVLRLICGQIDEAMIARIVTHLAEKTDIETWDGKTLLPELVLAVWCLGEARIPGKLTSAGDLLLGKVIAMILEASGINMAFVHDELLSATHEIGSRWPRTDQFSDRALMRVHIFVSFISMQIWPEFVFAISPKRELLLEFINADYSGFRAGAIPVLARLWPDADTRRLINERALQDEDGFARSGALMALVENWPDEETELLLKQRAAIDGVAAWLLGKQHSIFGKIVFSREIEGHAPYLDPRQPLPSEHIEKAANKAGIKPEELGDTLAALSAHMGWDVTKGSAHTEELS